MLPLLTVVNGEVEKAIISPELLGTGTPSATTFLRGDGAWQTPTLTASIDIGSLLYLNKHIGGF
jgi:hypothetical protein